MMEITKDTMIGDLLREDYGCAVILMGSGMHCVGCPSSFGESLEMACMVHGLDPDEVLATVQEFLSDKEAQQA